MTIFNINEAEELRKFSCFSVTLSPDDKETWEVHAQPQTEGKTEVIAKGFQTKRYASLFAELCECVTGIKG